jgi:hypothetical protein
MPRYTVYYKTTTLQSPFERPLLTFAKTYAETGVVEARDLDELASLLSYPKDEAFRANCARLKVHVSLSPGDVARDDSGNLWLRQSNSWKKVS